MRKVVRKGGELHLKKEKKESSLKELWVGFWGNRSVCFYKFALIIFSFSPAESGNWGFGCERNNGFQQPARTQGGKEE